MRAQFENSRLAEQFGTSIVKYNEIAIKILKKISFIFISSNNISILRIFEASNDDLMSSQYFLN